MGICIMTVVPIGPLTLPELVEAVNASTGWNMTLEELLVVKDRDTALSRLFNLREGMTRTDDRLPPRVFEPLASGARAGRKLDPDEFQKALQVYYREVGWDEEGVPTAPTLQQLELDWAIPILEEIEKLS